MFTKGSSVTAVPLCVLVKLLELHDSLKDHQPLGSNRFAALFNANQENEQYTIYTSTLESPKNELLLHFDIILASLYLP